MKFESMDINRIENRDNPVILLEHWMINTKRIQYAHYQAADHYSSQQKFFGIVSILFTFLVGTGLVTSILMHFKSNIIVLASLFSFIAAVMSALQTYLGSSNKSAIHFYTGVKYGSLRREIQTFMATKTDEELSSIVAQLEYKFEFLAVSSTPVPKRIWKKANEKFPAKSNDYYLMNDKYFNSS